MSRLMSALEVSVSAEFQGENLNLSNIIKWGVLTVPIPDGFLLQDSSYVKSNLY